jgi:hypothetical protein
MIENIADKLMSVVITRNFQLVEAIIFLCVKRIVTIYYEISPLVYVSVSP